MILLHVAKENDYKNSLQSGFYGNSSLKKDGFIHCSTIENVVDVANDNLKQLQEKLLILCVDAEKLSSEIKWEKRGSKGIKFPHIYGLLNLDAVINVVPFCKDSSGNFFLPDALFKYKKLI